MKNSISMIHINVRSLVAHIEEFEITMDTLIAPPLIGLSKTWLKPENDSLYNIPGYSIITNSRIGCSKGGVALMISDKIKFRSRPELRSYMSDDVESVFAEIEVHCMNFILGEIYRPLCWTNSINYLSLVIKGIANSGKKAYLLRDFNVDLE